MINQGFDPFRDRLSRDIRNDLSASLRICLHENQVAPARQVAEGFLARDLAPWYRSYIEHRLAGYERFLTQAASTPEDVLRQGLILWDLGLFFEVHELLEHAWLSARGEEKAFLQAMIRAAGVYIKRECGFKAAAEKMAAKARPVLASHCLRLAAHTDPDRLLAALTPPLGDPPHLLG